MSNPRVVSNQDLTCVIESNTLWIMEYLITCVLCQIHLWALHQLWFEPIAIGATTFGWVFNLFALLPEWNSICTSESNIVATYWPNSITNGIWSPQDAKLGVKLGIWYRRIGCKVFNHPSSQIGVLGGAVLLLAKVSDQNCQKSQVAPGGRLWQMMYNEKFCRYRQRSSATARADKYFFVCG